MTCCCRARLDVNHRRLAGDRDRLLESADPHLGANRHDAAARSSRPSRTTVAKPGRLKVTL